MGKRKSIFEKIAFLTDLPDEPIQRLPVIEIVGQSRVLIENHFGVVAYEPTEIKVQVTYGIVSVLGNNLEMARMTRGQLVITGIIRGIGLNGGTGI